MSEKNYVFGFEPGNDFIYDSHGNIIYGKGYIGAKRLPHKSSGLDAIDFTDKYVKIDDKIRLDFLKEDNISYSYEINLIKPALEEYEKDKHVSPLSSKNNLIKKLDKIAKKFIPYIADSYQLKYLLELYNILKVRNEFKIKEDEMNNDIYPTLNDFLNSEITRESIKYYKKIFEKDEDEKNIKDNIKYITQYILHRELKSKKNIQIIAEQLKFTNIQNKKQILEKVIYQLKEKFIDFNIYIDPNETYIIIDWS
jgi:hypothetical protein